MGVISQTVDNATQAVTSGGRGFLSNLIMAPLDGLAGMGKGLLGGIFSGIMWIGLPLLGLFALLPTVPGAALRAMGPKAVEWGHNLVKSGWTNMILTFLGIGGAAGAAWGGIKGLLGGVFGGHADAGENTDKASSAGSGIGGFIGGGLVLAAVSAIAIGAIHHIHLDDANAKLPDGPPKGPQPTAPQGHAKAAN